MKFLFDLDDTLVCGDIIEDISMKMYSEHKIDRIYTNNDAKHYDLRDLPMELAERVKKAFADPEYVWIKKPIKGALYFLHYLYHYKQEVGIVTARPITTKKETFKFLAARFHGICFDLGIHFANVQNCIDMVNLPSKGEILEDIAPDVYFDDNINYCLEAQKLGIKTYIVSNKFTPWNHEAEEDERVEVKRLETLRNVAFFPSELIGV